eukprot:365039-Chlamydomonas_euryale.AAC.4
MSNCNHPSTMPASMRALKLSAKAVVAVVYCTTIHSPATVWICLSCNEHTQEGTSACSRGWAAIGACACTDCRPAPGPGV